MLEESESVIHAGDPDEEGQLLIDEILRWFDYKKPVKRLNTGDTTLLAYADQPSFKLSLLSVICDSAFTSPPRVVSPVLSLLTGFL